MKLKKFINGKFPTDNDYNESYAYLYFTSGLNAINSLKDRDITFSNIHGVYGDAYVNETGQKNSVNTTDTSATFNTNKYEATDLTLNDYVLIEASDVVESDFIINDCNIEQIASNQWVVYTLTGTDEEKRAKIYATLFYGDITSKSPNALINSSVTNCTALKTTFSGDDGKRVYSPHVSANSFNYESDTSITCSLSFSDTTNNTGVKHWSRIQSEEDDVTFANASFSMDGTTIHSVSGTSTKNRLTNDTSDDYVDNPSTAELKAEAGNTGDLGYNAGWASAVIVTDSEITSSVSTSGDGSTSFSFNDYTGQDGIPTFTLTTDTVDLGFGVIYHDLPSGTLSNNVDSAFLTYDAADWEEGNDVQFKLANSSEETGFLPSNSINQFAPFSSEPDVLIIKLIPKDESPTSGYPSIRGYYVIGD